VCGRRFEATEYDVILLSDIVREILHPKKISPVGVVDNPGNDSQDMNTEELDTGSDKKVSILHVMM